MDDAFRRWDELYQQDIASVLHPFTNAVAHAQTGPDVVVRGEGSRVFDQHGRAYIDGMSGLWAVGLGYSEDRLVEAAVKQLRQLPYYHTFAHKTNPPSVALAAKLLSMLPLPMSKVFFTNSGSEAVDTAIKLAWYYWDSVGSPGKRHVIARQRAYHGVNVASGSATGLPVVHGGFSLPMREVVHVACPHHWRYAAAGETEADFSRRLADELEQTILRLGPENVAAFLAEPLMGAGGVIVPPEGYFPAIQAVLERHDVLMIADEVVCGFGRTGRMFGTETFSMRPDIMTFAKQLSSAYVPIGAVAISERVYEPIKVASDARGVFGHGYTYSGHPVAAAVALEALNIYQERDVVAQVQRAGPYFQARLGELRDHPLVGEVRGVGLIAAVELVADKPSKRMFEPFGKVNAFVARRAYEYGLITRALPASDSLGLCPPLFASTAELDEIVDLLKKALDDAIEYCVPYRGRGG